MVEVYNAAGVEIFHHQQVTVVRPVFDLDLTLCCFFHPVHEHTSEVLALGSKDCFVAVDWFLLHEENYVGEGWVVNDCAHVAD